MKLEAWGFRLDLRCWIVESGEFLPHFKFEVSNNETRKGRVLRVKRGYNPNSSSVGSDIPIFLAASAVAGLFATIALCIFDAKRRRNLDSTNEEAPPDSDGPL